MSFFSRVDVQDPSVYWNNVGGVDLGTSEDCLAVANDVVGDVVQQKQKCVLMLRKHIKLEIRETILQYTLYDMI